MGKGQYSVAPSKQRGVAAIWMGLSLVPIMGFAFWAVEGTRYVQESSRLKDATEAAVLAVTIADSEESSAEMAQGYVDAYVRDIDASQFEITRTYQERDDDNDLLEYIQYQVDSITTHDSWFASNFIPSFSEQQDLAAQSTAKKYPTLLGDNNIDIVFVSDFSGSMNRYWDSKSSCDSSNSGCKIADLKQAIEAVSENILCSSVSNTELDEDGEDRCADDADTTSDKLDNRIAFVPYNIRTREHTSNDTYIVSQLRYNDYNHSLSDYSYEDIDWDKWRVEDDDDIEDCADRYSKCDGQNNTEKKDNQQQAKRIEDVMTSRHDSKNKDKFETNNYDTYNYVDFDLSVSQMMVDKYSSANLNTAFRIDDNDLYSGFGQSSQKQFWNVELTNNISNLETIDEMVASGNTAAFQGILTGIQYLAKGDPNSDDDEIQEEYDNKVKMLLILSDGQESPDNGVLSGLVDAKLCDKARENIPGLYIGIIGIDFEADTQSGFQDCVLEPDEDIINVNNLDELIEKIEELIAKGAKTNGVTKLY
ncbi:TadE/TadG family type IV pilus assembly protein [Vibrio hippocampi]|uniref:Putative Flp pilus-assembly TadG-like N-terminal domain-containing protein n=1 Tax=Vibrio hippocampi TaxID=654686 RepID=A0ABN8DN65_9VIBR|nr:TadE/TadG family type IV pilus assembly protein [Vibrio hippocampi]CAH0529682.1 hypothetical protein VHP8226_03437 [Vibrio hippocampi]